MNKLTYPSHPNREAMQEEIDAYHRLHAGIVSAYLGQHVAVFEGQVVDHDANPAVLQERVRTNFPNKVVLSRKVTADPEPILHMRSPRLEHLNSIINTKDTRNDHNESNRTPYRVDP